MPVLVTLAAALCVLESSVCHYCASVVSCCSKIQDVLTVRYQLTDVMETVKILNLN